MPTVQHGGLNETVDLIAPAGDPITVSVVLRGYLDTTIPRGRNPQTHVQSRSWRGEIISGVSFELMFHLVGETVTFRRASGEEFTATVMGADGSLTGVGRPPFEL